MSFDGLDFKNTDMLKWGVGSGAGTGGKLTSLQADNNIWSLRGRIKALEDNPPEAVSIQSISVIGSQMQINMTDATTQGPFDLPVAAFRAVGEWVNEMALIELDIVTVTGSGLYMVLIDHTTPPSPAVFDPAAVDEDTGSPTFGQPLYQLVFPSAGGGGGGGVSEIVFFVAGLPGTGITTGNAICGRTFVSSVRMESFLPGSVAKLRVAPADGDLNFKIARNGTQVGSITFIMGQADGGFTFFDQIDLVAGDVVTLLFPDEGIDSAAKELSVTFKTVPL